MENDAKLGMFAGVAAVIVIAVVYFQKPEASAAVGPAKVTATAGDSTTPPNIPLAGMVVPSVKTGPKQSSP